MSAERPLEYAYSDLVGFVDVEEGLTGPNGDPLLGNSDQRSGGKALAIGEQVVPIENGCQQPSTELVSLTEIVVDFVDTCAQLGTLLWGHGLEAMRKCGRQLGDREKCTIGIDEVQPVVNGGLRVRQRPSTLLGGRCHQRSASGTRIVTAAGNT